ncbi:MAG: hypothetical protein SFV19_07045 [Rhodospirillaceae bacterium]|nr:hypothetical protein [Rhodospirillaceae bacterium]
MKTVNKLPCTFLAMGLASCSVSPSVQAQSVRRCSPAEISTQIPEFQPLWRAAQQRLWAFQDELATTSNPTQLNQVGSQAVDSIEAMSKLKTDTLRCVELDAFLFRTAQAGADLKAALERSDTGKAKNIASAIAQDFPYAADTRYFSYLYPGYVIPSPYWGYGTRGLHYGGYGHYSLHSHHHHHH